MKNHKVKMMYMCVGLLLVSSWCSQVFAKAEGVIKFNYRMPPPTNPLPRDLQTIVLLPPTANGQADGNTIDWDRIVRGMLRQIFERYRNHYAPKLLIQDRQDMGILDDEKGRIESGSLYGSDDTPELKQAAGDMLLISKIQYTIRRIQGHKEQPDIAGTVSSFMPWHWYYYGHPHAESHEVSEVAYNISVACEFKLLIAGKGGAPFRTYSGTLTNHEKTKSSIFLGIGSKSEADLTPVEEVIQRLVEQHILAFLSPVIPMRGTEVAYVSTHSFGMKRKEVLALKAGNWNEAARIAHKVAKHDRHYHKAYFVMGLAYEKLGNLRYAKGYYELAQRYGHDPQYAQGIARINRRIDYQRASRTAQPTASHHRSPSGSRQPTGGESTVAPVSQSEIHPLNGSVHLSIDVSPEVAAALRNAVRDRSANQTESQRTEEIVESALGDWLKGHDEQSASGK